MIIRLEVNIKYEKQNINYLKQFKLCNFMLESIMIIVF